MELFTRAQRQSFQLIYLVTRGIHFANPCLLRLFYIGGRVCSASRRSGAALPGVAAQKAESGCLVGQRIQCGIRRWRATCFYPCLNPAARCRMASDWAQKVAQSAYNARRRRALDRRWTRHGGEPRSMHAAPADRRNGRPPPEFPPQRCSELTWAGHRRPEDALPLRDTGYNPVMETAQRRLFDVGRAVAGQISIAAEVAAAMPEGATRSTALRPKKTIGPTYRLPA